MAHKAVIFDLDGTLLDTLADIAESMNSVLRRCGYPEHTRHEYKYLVGEGMESLARRALPEKHRDAASLAECVAGMHKEYGMRWAEQTRPYDGIDTLLNELARREIKMAVLSNKPDNFTREMVVKYFPNIHFEIVAGAKSTVPKKPHPASALEIATHLNILPADFLFVGDTKIDIETAVAAGMYPVGALWGFRTADELNASGARSLIEKPGELLALLK